MSRATLPLTYRRTTAALPALAAIFFVAAEAACALKALHAGGPFTAQPAELAVWIFAAAAAVIAVLALQRQQWTRWTAVLAPTAFAGAVLAATATLGGQAVAMLAASLAMTAPWYVGGHLLRWIGTGRLGERAIVAWLAGLAPLCLLTLLLGRLSLLKWWTMGVVVIVLGALGSVHATRAVWARRALIWSEIAGTSVGAVSAGVIVLTVAVAAIYTAAPEVQFDALYGKAYLPMLWARTGTIGPLTAHVQLNVVGWFELVASWGNLLGAPATGRYLQLFGLIAAPAVVWSWARRFGPWGPLAAVAVTVTPAIFWQATTADDDLLLALAGFALAVAVFDALGPNFAVSDRATGLALGLLAGTSVSLKLSLIPLCTALLLGWAIAGRQWRTIARRLAYGLVGALVTAGPPLLVRWLDTGNPVLPAYNNIFKSRYWPPINEKFDFPYYPHPGLLGPVKAVWYAMFNPTAMGQGFPPGVFGGLIGAIVVALLFGWRARRRVRGSFVLWMAILLAVAAWWLEFRYLRYLLPAAFVSVALLLAALGSKDLTAAGRRAAVGAVAVAGAASFAVAVAMFWDVPDRKLPLSAAIGEQSASDYVDAVYLQRPAIVAFNRIAPPGAIAVSNAFQRAWLTGGRDLDATWEVNVLAQLHGLPTSGDAGLSRLRAMGVSWALVDAPGQAEVGLGWLHEVLRTHGQLRFSARGWDLYELIDHPSRPVPFAPCDQVATGVPSCWRHSHTAAGESVVRKVAVCPGEIIAVNVTQGPAGAPSPVLITLVGAPPRDAFVYRQTVPGTGQSSYATVPSGSTEAVIMVTSLAGATVTRANVARLGSACRR